MSKPVKVEPPVLSKLVIADERDPRRVDDKCSRLLQARPAAD